jgi:DNA-binding NtrC family response regulator
MSEKSQFGSLVGGSAMFLKVVAKIQPLASSDATVLISGETGTGKELFALAIHHHSPRKGYLFIPVNCGALPEQLVENELFGHAKGAFTGAAAAEAGLLAEAAGGTLFLDEVDSLSPSAQAKLLRLLQNCEYRPLGSSKSIKADVRILVATNTDLRQQVEAKLFRQDLYHRLNVLSLHIPPLRDRMEDTSLLAMHFLTRYASQSGRGSLRFSPGATEKLLAYHWPGNVRELEGVIQRAVILSSSPVLQPDDLDLPFSAQDRAHPEGASFQDAKDLAIRQFERTYAMNLLTAYAGNVTWAAKAAGMDRRTFQRLLKRYGLDRGSFASRPDQSDPDRESAP